jgi:hypothetical protein
MRRKAGYSLVDHGRNEDTLEEFNEDPVENKSAVYRQKW